MLKRLNLFIILYLAVLAAQGQNVRVAGVGVAIWNVSDRGTGEQPMHPIGIPPKFEDNAQNRPGRQHYWLGERPALLRNLDYATVASDANDTRENSMDRIVVDQATTLLIAVATDELDAPGWTATSTSFNSTLSDFYVYAYDYTTPNEYIDIPFNDKDAPTIVFSEKGKLRYDNPPPISELAEGVTIDFAFSDYNRGDFTVDPHLIVLPNGDYIAGEKERRHISRDGGLSWEHLASNYRVEHASTFEHKGDLYIIGDEAGNSAHAGAVTRSTDGGRTWSTPVKLIDEFRNSPSHVEKSRGRIWIGYENRPRPHYVNVLSASEDSDLLDPSSWVSADNREPGPGNEPDMVLDRDGWPIVVTKGGSKIKASSPTEAARDGEFSLPGSGSKYSMKYDSISDKWWALTSFSPIPGNVRTGVTLFSSDDLENWTQERVVIQGTSTQFNGFNYPFLQFDGDDIVFVSRTAWPTELGQPQRWHDATMLSFHRVRNFRGGAVNSAPGVGFTAPALDSPLTSDEDLYVSVDATDAGGSIDKIDLYLDGTFVRTENYAPYEWGADDQDDPLLQNLAAGTYTLRVVATDNAGATAEESREVVVSSTNSGDGPTRDMDIYLLIGQSNMGGRGPITPEVSGVIPGVFVLRAEDDWVPAQNPINVYSTIQGGSINKMGPGYSFAIEMRNNVPDKQIGLVSNARGRTGLAQWMPGTNYYNEAVKHVRLAMEYGTLRGILWHQGEEDTKDAANIPIYLDSIRVMIQSLRDDLGAPDLPFVAGELYRKEAARYNDFNRMMRAGFPGLLPKTDLVLSEGATALSDNVHFDTEGQRLMGERYAEKMFNLLNALPRPFRPLKPAQRGHGRIPRQ